MWIIVDFKSRINLYTQAAFTLNTPSSIL